jgi:hypothetical protein
MSYQSKIAHSISGIRRKLFDYKIFVTGSESQVIRFVVREDAYKDREYELLDYQIIPFVVKLPDALPMTRLRTFDTLGNAVASPTDEASTSSIFLYDILPLEGYSRFSDNCERGDIIVQRIFTDRHDGQGGNDCYLFVMQIAETVGNIDISELVWKRHNLAPYTRELPPDVVDIINTFKSRLT